jgi:beta-ketodecanoyl-[acyl-carrier-protein] synthase
LHPVVITATGLFTPPNAVTNAELVEALNLFTAKADSTRPAGEEPLQPSSEEFIVKASGIRARYVMNKSGVLDPDRMRPLIPERSNEKLSIMAETGGAGYSAGTVFVRKR